MSESGERKLRTLKDLADEIAAEGRIPVDMVGHPDFFMYDHQTGEPVIPDRKPSSEGAA